MISMRSWSSKSRDDHRVGNVQLTLKQQKDSNDDCMEGKRSNEYVAIEVSIGKTENKRAIDENLKANYLNLVNKIWWVCQVFESSLSVEKVDLKTHEND